MDTLEYTKYILKQNNTFAKKRLGQNFLISDEVLKDIVEEANISTEDEVIEIGPGLGNLTKYLLEKALNVTAFEIDSEMINILNKRFNNKNLKIEKEDILKVNINDYIKNKKVKIVANIPYYITSLIIFKLLEYKDKIESITLMIQNEVADRLVAIPKNKDYGVLTINVKAICEVRKAFIVKKENFLPAPKVDSAVVTLIPNNRYDIKNKEKFENLVKCAFSSRRKTISNSLSNANFNNMSKDEINLLLEKQNIDLRKRPEEITIEQYIQISNKI